MVVRPPEAAPLSPDRILAGMNVLFSMSHAGHVRNFEWTVRMLAEAGHAVHVGLDQDEKENLAGHSDLLHSLVAEYPTITCDVAPARQKTDWSSVALGAQRWLDYLRYLEPEFTAATKLRSRAGGGLPDSVKRITDGYLARSPEARRAARRLLEATHEGVPVLKSVRRWMERHDPDVLVVTPML